MQRRCEPPRVLHTTIRCSDLAPPVTIGYAKVKKQKLINWFLANVYINTVVSRPTWAVSIFIFVFDVFALPLAVPIIKTMNHHLQGLCAYHGSRGGGSASCETLLRKGSGVGFRRGRGVCYRWGRGLHFTLCSLRLHLRRARWNSSPKWILRLVVSRCIRNCNCITRGNGYRNDYPEHVYSKTASLHLLLNGKELLSL